MVMGIINTTPDSFYDGGMHNTALAALRHGKKLQDEGALILDIGGESTRPGSRQVDSKTEKERILPVIQGLDPSALIAQGIALSVDTWKADVAVCALEAGASIVNDISACRFDPDLLDVLCCYQPGYVLMHSPAKPAHMQSKASYTNVVDDVLAFFENRLNVFTKAGLQENRIVLDPGIGFGKLLHHNLELLAHIEAFKVFGLPILVGLSNKSLFQDLLGLPATKRQQATQAATVVLGMKGVNIHRVHEVAPAVESLAIVRALGCREKKSA